jgi:hypothetical protein
MSWFLELLMIDQQASTNHSLQKAKPTFGAKTGANTATARQLLTPEERATEVGGTYDERLLDRGHSLGGYDALGLVLIDWACAAKPAAPVPALHVEWRNTLVPAATPAATPYQMATPLPDYRPAPMPTPEIRRTVWSSPSPTDN